MMYCCIVQLQPVTGLKQFMQVVQKHQLWAQVRWENKAPSYRLSFRPIFSNVRTKSYQNRFMYVRVIAIQSSDMILRHSVDKQCPFFASPYITVRPICGVHAILLQQFHVCLSVCQVSRDGVALHVSAVNAHYITHIALEIKKKTQPAQVPTDRSSSYQCCMVALWIMDCSFLHRRPWQNSKGGYPQKVPNRCTK